VVKTGCAGRQLGELDKNSYATVQRSTNATAKHEKFGANQTETSP
jgi:hypothetical protein